MPAANINILLVIRLILTTSVIDIAPSQLKFILFIYLFDVAYDTMVKEFTFVISIYTNLQGKTKKTSVTMECRLNVIPFNLQNSQSRRLKILTTQIQS